MHRIFIFLLLLLIPFVGYAGYSNVSGKWSPEKYVPVASVQEHYDRGLQSIQAEDWSGALTNFMVIVYHFDDTPFYSDALFQTGVCYYQLGDFEVANKQINKYLDLSGKLKYFEKAFEYKLAIADQFAQGKKKHLFGWEKMPKIASAKETTLELYDEIIAALPAKDLAAQALFKKAELLKAKGEFKESIDSLQALARRFPKHPLSADSYLLISKIYLEQSRIESQNPDLIALAQVNLQRFGRNFPGEERLESAHQNLLAMQEVFAQSLYDTGRFYERKKKPHASVIYYRDTLQKYPGTIAAQKSRDRLVALRSYG